jgi:hypothetical protein
VLAGEGIGLGQALAEGGLAKLAGLAVVGVDARIAGGLALEGQANIAGGATDVEARAAANSGRTFGETPAIDALVAGRATLGGSATKRPADTSAGVGTGKAIDPAVAVTTVGTAAVSTRGHRKQQEKPYRNFPHD